MTRRSPAWSLAAFTYVELMITLGIMMVLLSLATISIGHIIPDTDLRSTAQQVIADLGSQQLHSMRRELGYDGSDATFGIYFTTDSYVLFQGTGYSAADPNNRPFELPSGLTFSTITVPGQLVRFERGSGEVVNYVAEQNRVVLTHAATGRSVVLSINPWGIVEAYE